VHNGGSRGARTAHGIAREAEERGSEAALIFFGGELNFFWSLKKKDV